MKLVFKSPLTKKSLPHINLRAGLNWCVVSLAVLPSSNLGEGHARTGSKRVSLPLRPARAQHRRGIAGAEWHPRESPRPSLSTARHAFGAARRDRDSRGSPATSLAGEYLR